MIQLKDKSNCCGCTACATICPHDAISMKPDAMGFLYPNIDYTLCVDCHLCEKVCAFNENYDKYLNLLKKLIKLSFSLIVTLYICIFLFFKIKNILPIFFILKF